MQTNHDRFMQLAVFEARKGLGRTAPNPSVGCVIVKSGRVIARARTCDGGRPHAEQVALLIAGSNAKDCEIYVTLEPCTKGTQHISCSRALIEAQVKSVFIGCIDQNPDIAGTGVKMLEDAGIQVEVGILEKECQKLAEGFFYSKNKKRPFITLKIATSLDGKIATSNGHSQWITNTLSRRRAHLERSYHDAILVGSSTMLKDNPDLTARLPGLEHKMTRIICDSNLKTPPDSKIFHNSDQHPVLIICQRSSMDTSKDSQRHLESLKAAGAHIQAIDDIYNLDDMLSILVDHGITRLMIEGGSKINASFLKSGFVDRVLWFRAPIIIGSDGLSAINDLDVAQISHSIKLTHVQSDRYGEDVLDIFEKNA